MTLVVRPARPADAAAVAALYAPYVTGGVASFEEEAPDAAAVAARMAARPRLPWLLAERDGLPVGYAYASAHHPRAAYRWSADVTVYLADGERGRGTGRALYAVLLPLLRELGLTTAHAGITLPNDPSVGLHEALGFRRVGTYTAVGFKHGRWHDVGWWQLALVSPAPSPPQEPREWEPGEREP